MRAVVPMRPVFLPERRGTAVFVTLLSPQGELPKEYPCTVPVATQELRLEKSVTVLSGDNGSGKTTLLELLAAKTGAVRIGSGVRTEKQIQVARAAEYYRIVRKKRERGSFFFSAEGFIKYIEWTEREKTKLREELSRVDEEYAPGSFAHGQASMAFARELSAMEGMYGRRLAHSSHGEGFYEFFKSRLIPEGLYLLDEPEAALSLQNQYALALLICDSAKEGCQFVISTHSPVLSGIPGADILAISDEGIERTDWEHMESIAFLKMFLARRDLLFE